MVKNLKLCNHLIKSQISHQCAVKERFWLSKFKELKLAAKKMEIKSKNEKQ